MGTWRSLGGRTAGHVIRGKLPGTLRETRWPATGERGNTPTTECSSNSASSLRRNRTPPGGPSPFRLELGLFPPKHHITWTAARLWCPLTNGGAHPSTRGSRSGRAQRSLPPITRFTGASPRCPPGPRRRRGIHRGESLSAALLYGISLYLD